MCDARAPEADRGCWQPSTLLPFMMMLLWSCASAARVLATLSARTCAQLTPLILDANPRLLSHPHPPYPTCTSAHLRPGQPLMRPMTQREDEPT